MRLCNTIRLQEYINTIGFSSMHAMEKLMYGYCVFSLMSIVFPYVERRILRTGNGVEQIQDLFTN